jgi:hypothetical protein
MGRWFSRRWRPSEVIDLRERLSVDDSTLDTATTVPSCTPEVYAALQTRRRAEVARKEARRELEELRQRHWSPERVLEESRLGVDWWEHPLADPHAVLGLLPGDTLDAATGARRAIAKGVHPDINDDPDTGVRQMTAVNGAYERIRRAKAPLPVAAARGSVDRHPEISR